MNTIDLALPRRDELPVLSGVWSTAILQQGRSTALQLPLMARTPSCRLIPGFG